MVFTRDTSKKFKDKKLNVKNINTTNLKKATHFLYVQVYQGEGWHEIDYKRSHFEDF
jgi:hypothetical protein